MARLLHLRELMFKEHSQLFAYIVPTDDAHQSEYIAECDKRREYICGFTGSAGLAVVTKEQAFLWTDGRYHLQASQELDLNLWTLMRQGNEGIPSPDEWMAQSIPKDGFIGFDPNLISYSTFQKYSKAMKKGCGGILVPVKDNLVDKVWENRPSTPDSDIIVLPLKYSGQSWQEKVENVRKKMSKVKASLLVVTALDEVAWLFNMRGSDINFNPVFFAYAIVTTNDIRLYISEARANSPYILNYLQGVIFRPYSKVASDLQDLIPTCCSDTKVWISKESSYALVHGVPKTQLYSETSPIQELKGVKNEVEIEGMRTCHIRDSAALCEYLCWLEKEVPKGYLDEVSAANKLETFRKEQPSFVSLSFPTISSSGPNGAIIHYHPMPETARLLSPNELYLCDSGAQYLDGTTDVTRTISFGEPSHKEQECFTLVLKGHIALCSAIFPNKTMGNQLDCLARHALWESGLDYKHGTGHGVGAFLNVHEGPHGIGKTRPYSKPLQSDMFVTDEPGYYEDGTFGIRIENVELIKKVKTKYNFSDVHYLTMEPVTLVPIQLKMVDISLLTKKEVDWLNNYHSTCLKVVGKYLTDSGKEHVVKWLQQETKPL